MVMTIVWRTAAINWNAGVRRRATLPSGPGRRKLGQHSSTKKEARIATMRARIDQGG